MRKNTSDIYQSGKGCKSLPSIGTPAKRSESHYPQMDITWNSGEPSQQWKVYQCYSKRASTVHPGGHKKKKRKYTKGIPSLLSLNLTKLTAHNSALRKRPGKNSVHVRIPRQNPLLTKKNAKASIPPSPTQLDLTFCSQGFPLRRQYLASSRARHCQLLPLSCFYLLFQAYLCFVSLL